MLKEPQTDDTSLVEQLTLAVPYKSGTNKVQLKLIFHDNQMAAVVLLVASMTSIHSQI
jgi:hypothetical protein